jgi:TPR repeat protein
MRKYSWVLLIMCIGVQCAESSDNKLQEITQSMTAALPHVVALAWEVYQANHPGVAVRIQPTIELRDGVSAPPHTEGNKVVIGDQYLVQLMYFGIALGHDAYVHEFGSYPSASEEAPPALINSVLLQRESASSKTMMMIALNGYALLCKEQADDCTSLVRYSEMFVLEFVVAHEVAHIYNNDPESATRSVEEEGRADAFAIEVLEKIRPQLETRGSIGRAYALGAAEAPLLVLDYELSKASGGGVKELKERRDRVMRRYSESQKEDVSVFQPIETVLQPLRISAPKMPDWVIIDGIRLYPTEVFGKELFLPRAQHTIAAGTKTALSYTKLNQDETNASLEFRTLTEEGADRIRQRAAAGDWLGVLLSTADQQLKCRTPTLVLQHWEALRHLGLDSAVDVSLIGEKDTSRSYLVEVSRYIDQHGDPTRNQVVLESYRDAASHGDEFAENVLGSIYWAGTGVPMNPSASIRWYTMAAEQGNSAAQVELAGIYGTGAPNFPVDFHEMFKWIVQAAESGNATAQFNLGQAYDQGRGTLPDPVQALYWYRLAADQGNKLAPYNMSLLYLYGRGVAQNDSEATRWALIGANGGDAVAQYAYGRYLEQGKGVPKNQELAYQWMLIASANGEQKESQTEIDRLWHQLPENERKKAEDAASEWIDRHQ